MPQARPAPPPPTPTSTPHATPHYISSSRGIRRHADQQAARDGTRLSISAEHRSKVDRSLRFGASLAQCDSITDKPPPVRHAAAAAHILPPDRGVRAVSRSSTVGQERPSRATWTGGIGRLPGATSGRKKRGKANRAK